MQCGDSRSRLGIRMGRVSTSKWCVAWLQVHNYRHIRTVYTVHNLRWILYGEMAASEIEESSEQPHNMQLACVFKAADLV